jgi:hypothetical protein
MILAQFPEVQRLTAAEKLQFVSHPESLPVSPEIVEALDQRMEHFRQHPDAVTTWEAAKERILSGSK